MSESGTVISVHRSLVKVVSDGELYIASIRRNLRWHGRPPRTRRLAVGDRVGLGRSGKDRVIDEVFERSNALIRKAPDKARAQVLAANIDRALVVFSTHEPEPKPRLIDRFLVGCHQADIPAVLVINKIDLGCESVEHFVEGYRALGLPVHCCSAVTGADLEPIRELLESGTSLFCGPSGVGKSSLLNSVYPGFELKVGEISEATGKGRHTTTRAELLVLPDGGLVVDTPGLREFGLWDLEVHDLVAAFPEIAEAASAGCHFADCSHDHEPDCAVKAAVATTITNERYSSYLRLLEEIQAGR